MIRVDHAPLVAIFGVKSVKSFLMSSTILVSRFAILSSVWVSVRSTTQVPPLHVSSRRDGRSLPCWIICCLKCCDSATVKFCELPPTGTVKTIVDGNVYPPIVPDGELLLVPPNILDEPVNHSSMVIACVFDIDGIRLKTVNLRELQSVESLHAIAGAMISDITDCMISCQASREAVILVGRVVLVQPASGAVAVRPKLAVRLCSLAVTNCGA